MLTTTETLLKGLAAGNESRWARFYRDYAPYLESVVLKKCPSILKTTPIRKPSFGIRIPVCEPQKPRRIWYNSR